MFTHSQLEATRHRFLDCLDDTADLNPPDQAARMLQLVNEIRDERGHPHARLSQVMTLQYKDYGKRNPCLAYALLALHPTYPV